MTKDLLARKNDKKRTGAFPKSQIMQLKSILEGYKSDLETKKRNKLSFKYSPQKFKSFDNKRKTSNKEAANHSID